MNRNEGWLIQRQILEKPSFNAQYPVSTALSNCVLEKIDKEASKQ